MLYGSECWAVDKKIERRMLRGLSGVTKKDRLRNVGYAKESIGVGEVRNR